MALSEATYQNQLVKKLQQKFPDCFVIRNDPSVNQGMPDLLILFGKTWAMLEVKLYATAPLQPNQDYYVNVFDDMSYAAFIYPENEEEILRDLQFAFRA